MGNTPSNQASPARGGERASNATGAGPSGGAGGGGSSSRQPNLRLPMPQRPTHISPNSSNPTSPSGGRSGSPRRRKSLELPDLNKLSFTPAAPVPTLATHTSHHLAPSTPAAGHSKRSSIGGTTPSSASNATDASSSRRWRHALGGRVNSPLANANALGAMSRLDPAVPGPRTAPVSMPNASVSPSRATDGSVNPYFPSSPPQSSPSKRNIPKPVVGPIAIPGKEKEMPTASPVVEVTPHPRPGTEAPPSTVAPTPPSRLSQEALDTAGEMKDGLVNVPVQWNGGGKNVFVTGNFADNWKGRIKLKKSTHDFNTILRLTPGQYRLKFIVDDSWRCSKQIPTATDDDGTLVNWIEVEAPKTAEELKAEWAMDAKPAAKQEDTDDSQWTSTIPAPLVLFQYIEELPMTFDTQHEYEEHLSRFPHLTAVPQPPMLPRILDKVILNADPKRSLNERPGNQLPGGLDDNSILAVPNHVVLNHLTASAIKNGTLGVATTTRYRKKYITTMYFKPTLSDLLDGQHQLPDPEQPPALDEEVAAEEKHQSDATQPQS